MVQVTNENGKVKIVIEVEEAEIEKKIPAILDLVRNTLKVSIPVKKKEYSNLDEF